MSRVRDLARPVRPMAFLAGLVGALSWASPAAAQEGCQWLPPSGTFNRQVIGQSTIVRVSTPHMACQGGMTIRADSARYFEATDFLQFFGNVVFRNPEHVLRAWEAQYYRGRRQLNAQGDVHLTRTTDGATITGGNLQLLQQGPSQAQDRLTVTGLTPEGDRPHARLMVRPDTTTPAEEAPPVRAGPLAGDTTGAATDTTTREAGVGEEAADTSGAVAKGRAEGVDSATVVVPPDTTTQEAGVGEEEADTTAAPPERLQEAPDTTPVAYDVDADQIVLEGENAFRARGNVEIVQDSLRAFGNTATYTEGGGTLVLTEVARVVGSGYELSGDVIRALMPGREDREIVSEDRAVLTGEELRLAAPEIRVYVVAGSLERLVAVSDSAPTPEEAVEGAPPPPPAGTVFELEHPPRPVARAEDFLLVADSMEVISPGQVLERLVAAGAARGESTARDSLNTPTTPAVARRDWLEGDTIIAMFSEVAPRVVVPVGPPEPERPDSARGRYRLDRLVAKIDARTLYRTLKDSASAATPDSAGGTVPEEIRVDTLATDVAASLPDSVSTAADSAAAGPAPAPRLALDYVVGDTITIILHEGEVERMEVVGQTQGVHMEPGSVRGRDANGGTPGAARREDP